MNKKQLRKRAMLSIAAVIESSDLECLFGEDLCDEQYKKDQQWVDDELDKVQKKAVKLLTRSV